ncbi:MAG TPA: ATP-binding cassette domain-containing protein, partial [Coriobacteriia bacterium]|nr:ATP-binding cassette domain-containing protein [Coriobacteriia bacterium]
EDKAKKRVETFSGGMKRRINIAAGVLHRPKVLLMDEPTVGIDPQSRNHILGTVRDLNADGMTVLYTSHYMDEVEALCDRIAIVDHGKVIASGTIEELRSLVGDEDVVRVTLGVEGALTADAHAQGDSSAEDPDGAGAGAIGEMSPEIAASLSSVRDLKGVSRADAIGATLEIIAPDAASVLGGIIESVTRTGASVRAVEVVEPDLESVFLHLTGRGLRD